MLGGMTSRPDGTDTGNFGAFRIGGYDDNDRIRSPPIPPDIIRHAVWLYLRFTLSFRDVEDLLAERGLDVSYETVRRWVLKFEPLFAKELRRRRHRPTSQWHLDEMAVLITGRQFWLWRAVDDGVKFLICWCSGGATPGQPRGSCANCSRSVALRPLCW